MGMTLQGGRPAAARGHRAVSLAVSLLVASVGLCLSGGPAVAGEHDAGGGETENGYYAYVVRLSGDVSSSKRASIPRPPPLCWWAPVDAPDPDDAAGVYEWFETKLDDLAGYGGIPSEHTKTLVPSYPESFEQAIEADRTEPGVTWYNLQFGPAHDYTTPSWERIKKAGCTTLNQFQGVDTFVQYNYFPYQQPPEPQVDARTLAEYTFNVMYLVSPELDWNPKIGAAQDATLVNLPTWMWVRDAQAVQTRTVTAEVGNLSVTVTATTDGLSITSPAGAKECSAAEAKYAWGPGKDQAKACVLRFKRSSAGYADGFPVAARTGWNATWQASNGESDSLAPKLVGETTDISVAQSQALVTEVD